VQHTDSIRLGIVGAEAVGTDKLGQMIGMVCIGFPYRPHFVKNDANAALRDLKGGLAAGKSAANDMNNR
jgi:hypothetical protein